MKKTLVHLVALITLVIVPNLAYSSDFESATIEVVRPDNFDVGGVFIRMNGTMTGTKVCAYPDGASKNWYFITRNNNLMKELLSVSLSAKLSSKSVRVYGSGTCTSGYEDVRFIQIN